MTITNPAFVKSGFFVPALTFGGASVGMVYTVQNGFYTQMGNVVTFMILLGISNKGSSTGIANISNLPVSTGANGGDNIIPCQLTNVTLSAGYSNTSFVFSNFSNEIEIDQFGSGVGNLALQDTNFSNTVEIMCSGTYLVGV